MFFSFSSKYRRRNFIGSNGFSFLQRNQTLERNIRKKKKNFILVQTPSIIFPSLNCYIFNRVMNYNGQCNLFYWSSVSHWFYFTYLTYILLYNKSWMCYRTYDILYFFIWNVDEWNVCLIHISNIFRNKISCAIIILSVTEHLRCRICLCDVNILPNLSLVILSHLLFILMVWYSK